MFFELSDYGAGMVAFVSADKMADDGRIVVDAGVALVDVHGRDGNVDAEQPVQSRIQTFFKEMKSNKNWGQ